MNEIKVFGSKAVSSAPRSSMQSAALRRAYMQGFHDAISTNDTERDTPAVSPAAMVFGFLCWVAMLFFVFR